MSWKGEDRVTPKISGKWHEKIELSSKSVVKRQQHSSSQIKQLPASIQHASSAEWSLLRQRSANGAGFTHCKKSSKFYYVFIIFIILCSVLTRDFSKRPAIFGKLEKLPVVMAPCTTTTEPVAEFTNDSNSVLLVTAGYIYCTAHISHIQPNGTHSQLWLMASSSLKPSWRNQQFQSGVQSGKKSNFGLLNRQHAGASYGAT